MIRYPVTKEQLEQMIEGEKPGWLANAAKRTEGFRQKGYYEEGSPIWSQIKAVYMRLQGNGKCAYCERQMESVELGKVEQDVEHFRPKGNVKAWKAPPELLVKGITFSNPPADHKGYYLLPYHPFNYASACKPCNSTLKSDYFPIAGSYNLNADDPTTLHGEKPYLICPIGAIDDDPEELIEFYGASPRPVAKAGHDRNRALVTIAFFELDNPDSRKNLYRDRAMVIMALYPFLEKTTVGTAAEKTAAVAKVERLLKPQLRHLNCARSFKNLFESNPAEAKAIYDNASELMDSIS